MRLRLRKAGYWMMSVFYEAVSAIGRACGAGKDEDEEQP